MSQPRSAYDLAARRRRGSVNAAKITLAHGGGGKAMRDLIDDVFLSEFDNPALAPLDDQARLDMGQLLGEGDRLAFTTDSFVVDPLEFPGGDIGKLAIAGTVNDLAVGGARPLFLSTAMIIEEGAEVGLLRRIARSMASTAAEVGVTIVAGDTKVVGHGACDKLFINTSGLGVIPKGIDLGPHRIRPGDTVLVSGRLGDHGAAILNARGDLALSASIESDCAPLNNLISGLLTGCSGVRFLRDPTRGGLASLLNEVAEAAAVGVELVESTIPMHPEVKAMCEILGLDPLYLANEGKIACIVASEAVDAALSSLRRHRLGATAAVVGHVVADHPGRVVMETVFGARRVVDMLVGDQLPRIC
jgi:hydrogenase expression/formation protein HypE